MVKRIIKKLIDLIGYEITNKKVFGNNILRDIDLLVKSKRSLIIFDIGANLGQTSIEFSEKWSESTIFSFEPDPSTYADLNKNVIDFKNIKTFNLGLGNRTEQRELFINKISGGNSLLTVSENISKFAKGGWTELKGSTNIDVVKLDDFCIREKIERIDILKIDTQGFELKIIEGGTKVIIPTFTKIIYIEVLFVELYKEQAYFNEIYNVLTQRGYRLLGFYNKFNKIEQPHYLLWCDAIFVCE